MLIRVHARAFGVCLLLAFAVIQSEGVSANVIQGTLSLRATEVTGLPFGFTESEIYAKLESTEPFALAPFSVDLFNGESKPDGDYPASLSYFYLSIGNTQWDQTMPHSDLIVRLLGGSVLGIEVQLTYTLPGHPDLSFFLPSSPGQWEAEDLDGSKVIGTYQVISATSVPEPATLYLVAAGLAGLAGFGGRSERRRGSGKLHAPL